MRNCGKGQLRLIRNGIERPELTVGQGRQLEAFFKARAAYTAARYLHNEALAAEALALGRGLSALVAAAAPPGQ